MQKHHDRDKDKLIERTLGRDVKEGNTQQDEANLTEEEKQKAREATTGEGLAHSAGTPGKQKTSGANNAGHTKLTSEELGEADRHGSAGASGPPGSSRNKSGDT